MLAIDLHRVTQKGDQITCTVPRELVEHASMPPSRA
jgi:hypothetical protein